MPFRDPEYRRVYHAEQGRQWIKNERARRIAASVCIRCRTPVTKYRECLDCRKLRAEHYMSVIRPKLRRLAARCKGCRQKCVQPGARRCGKCTAKRASQIRWGKVAA